MERAIIESTVASIPHSQVGEIQQDHEIWEEQDGGAKLMVTRHIISVRDRYEMISLSVSGEPSERHRVIREFIDVFGRPFEPVLYSSRLDVIDVIVWLQRRT